MAEIFRLPAVSPTMELGTIVAWRVAEGQAFASGDVLVEIGTDKATVEAQIYDDGVLLAQLVPVDAEVPVNAPIAVFGKAGEDAAAVIAAARAELAGAKPTAPPAPTPASAPEARAAEPAPPTAEAAPPAQASAPPEGPRRTWAGRPLLSSFLEPPGDLGLGARTRGRIAASPLARKVAAERGVDLARVRGTGPGGRIVRADVEGAGAAPAGAAAAPVARADETLKLTPMRKTIARRLTEVHQTVPTFFLTVGLDASALVGMKDGLKKLAPDVEVGVNDVLMLAVARALRAFPRANASFTDQGIVLHGSVDLGFAVALDEGLITPVIRGADRLSLPELAGRIRDLAGRARAGKLEPAEYQGNTFTVSNLGMFGIEHFTAILNPPAAAILAVGAVEAVPVVRGGAVVPGHRLNVTMTCDHRALDGAVGAQFLQVLRRFVEQPALMLVP